LIAHQVATHPASLRHSVFRRGLCLGLASQAARNPIAIKKPHPTADLKSASFRDEAPATRRCRHQENQLGQEPSCETWNLARGHP
jgi:hypothetical protein